MIGLTSLIVKDPPMLPKLNPERARLVIQKIDSILAWENSVENTRDSKFVELGKYLCEVRAGQYWRFLIRREPGPGRREPRPDNGRY